MTSPPESAADDARDLRRGVAVNMLGYAIKLAHPVLLAIATRLYGAESFGVFIVSQAAVMMLARVCLFGLDKGVLWWVPRQEPSDERRGVLGALLVATVSSAVVAAGMLVIPTGWIATWTDDPGVPTAMRIMALGIVPLAASEVLLHATMAKRRMEPQVIVRETLVPVTLLGAATALFFAGAGAHGLAIAFLLSHLVGFAGAAIAFGRVFRGSRFGARPLELPPKLRRYAGPWWISEMTNTALQRTDVVILAMATDPFVVGVYGIVVQFANAVRAIRRSFDPIVTAIVSRISARPDPERLATGYSYATVLVTATQVPVFVFLALFGEWLLPLYGEGFEAGARALVVFCVFWGVLGAAGLAGVVVAGYGYSKLTLLNVVVALAVQAPLVYVLGDRFGLEGAAAAVGIAYTVQHALQLAQMRYITGQWCYTRSVVPMLVTAAGSVALSVAAYVALAAAGELVQRLGAFAVFAAGYGAATLYLYRSGRLGAVLPDAASAPDSEEQAGSREAERSLAVGDGAP